MSLCKAPTCEREHFAKGYCYSHYHRLWKSGRANEHIPIQSMDTAERFQQWITFDKESGCWLWQGTLDRDGYARFQYGRGHRWAYQHFVGSIPQGLELDHLCRVRHCVNPEHLEPVTTRTNQLRGNGVSGINARKTHCKRGHPFNEVNTYIRPDGHRDCRTCRRTALKQSEDRRRRLVASN